ncbi:MAG: MGMT family protein [Candidatus Aenigmatarchaeota archaeon]|nr:MAG: MGMT family protein [Candidatus Aenigmarchaeota archaeon]
MKFSERVLDLCRKVPKGRVTTYGEIARVMEKPRASRAVGQALKRNPKPIEIPCHRVVRSDGSLGGYGGSGRKGAEKKKALLRGEGVNVKKDKIKIRDYLYRF